MEEKNKKKRKFIILVVAVVLVVVAIIAILLWRRQSEANTEESAVTDTEGIIQYNGKYYQYNDQIKNYLFLGVDKDGEMVASKYMSEGGQSDAIMILVQDDENETLRIIAINRNAMTDIDVYGITGDYVETKEAQICLQYAYGDGAEVSCERTSAVVSNLLFDLPIEGYFAMNMDGIGLLNDAVGGVEVEILEDINEEVSGTVLTAGETMTLSGVEAYVYLRWRDTDAFDSVTNRLQRQKQYLKALFEKVKQIDSATEMLDIYDVIKNYSVTNLSLTDLASELKVLDYEFNDEIYELPGETVMGEKYEEFYVEEEALYELLIEIYYDEVDNPNEY